VSLSKSYEEVVMGKKVSRPAHKAPAKAQEQKSGKKGGRKEFNNKNRGAMFPNDKDGNEKRPDFTGVIEVVIPDDVEAGDLVKFRLAGWERESQSGVTYLSLTIQKADKQGSNRGAKKDDDE